MRIPDRAPRLPRSRSLSNRGRAILFTLGVIAVVFVVSIRGIARTYTDYLWFDSLGVSSVWQRQWGVQIVLGLVFGAVFFALVYGNQLLAERLEPPVLPVGNGEDLIVRYRELIEGHQSMVRLVVSGLFALVAGFGASAQWQNWLLFRFGGKVGVNDPLNKVDLGFYLFWLPFLSFVVSWLFAALLIVTLVSLTTHFLGGAIRLPGTGAISSHRAKAHLSVLLAVMAVVKAADYWLERYTLTLSNRGVVSGALYTDVNASRPALTLLILIALGSAAVFLINIGRRGWGLPSIAVVLWVVVALVAGVVYPAGMQRLRVEAQQSALEAPFITRNIESTRAAYGLDRIERRNFDYSTKISDAEVTNSASTVSNIRLLDPGLMTPTFNTTQAKVDYFQFGDLDVDRYPVNGAATQVLISARDLNPATIPADTWEGRHLSFTHGYGVAVAPVNAVTSDGLPKFAVGDVPTQIDSKALPGVRLDHPEIYFGEGLDGTQDSGYAIVATKLKERGEQYTAGGGVQVNSLLRQAAFALRFGDIEPVISNYLTDKSRVLYIRGIRDRAQALAPFLQWDSDPYPVLVDGRIKYVLDGYTTSASYPYAQPFESPDISDLSGLATTRFNYVRNAVKTVVDAYDGTTTMYLADTLDGGKPDPIIHAYAKAFPDLFKPATALPGSIRAHLRYPEDLFRVQTSMWGRYHLTDPGDFYRQEDGWDVAQDPPADIKRSVTTDGLTGAPLASKVIAPYYLQMQLPAEKSDEFVIFRPFVPHTQDSTSPKKQLNSFMVGRSDPGQYGKLVVYTMTQVGSDGKRQRNRNVDGPLTMNDKILSDTGSKLSERLTQLNGQGGGSVVKLGNMLMVPIGKGLLYIRPIYLSGEDSGSSRQLRIVVVAYGDEVQIGDTLSEALGKLFPTAKVTTREQPATPTTQPGGTGSGGGAGGTGGATTGGSGSTASSPSELIAKAVVLFDEADKALRSGGAEGLAEYQTKTAKAEELVREAEKSLGVAVGGSSTTTTGVTTTTAK